MTSQSSRLAALERVQGATRSTATYCAACRTLRPPRDPYDAHDAEDVRRRIEYRLDRLAAELPTPEGTVTPFAWPRCGGCGFPLLGVSQ